MVPQGGVQLTRTRGPGGEHHPPLPSGSWPCRTWLGSHVGHPVWGQCMAPLPGMQLQHTPKLMRICESHTKFLSTHFLPMDLPLLKVKESRASGLSPCSLLHSCLQEPRVHTTLVPPHLASRAFPRLSPILSLLGGNLAVVLFVAFLQGCQKSGWKSQQPPPSPSLPTPAFHRTPASGFISDAEPCDLVFWAPVSAGPNSPQRRILATDMWLDPELWPQEASLLPTPTSSHLSTAVQDSCLIRYCPLSLQSHCTGWDAGICSCCGVIAWSAASEPDNCRY